MVDYKDAYLITTEDKYLNMVSSIQPQLKEKIREIERLRLRTVQDLYIVAGQIYSLDLHPIDSWKLFRWMQEHNVPSRYIIRCESVFFEEIESKGQTKDVVAVNSDCLHDELLDETELLVRAKAFIVEWRTDSIVDIWLQHLQGCRYVFLQHGVVGLWLTDELSRVFREEYNDINVSSEFEISLLAHNQESRKKFFVGGLPRYDSLQNCASKDVNAEKAVFVMLTWRNELNNNSVELDNSPYIKGILELFSADNVQRLKQNNIRIVFAPHHVIAHRFKNIMLDGVDVVTNQEDISYWISHAHALVTDFSSVSYDFLFQEKPVIYWIPDKEDAQNGKLSHEDAEKVLSALELRKNFFNTVDSIDEVMHLLIQYRKNNFKLEDRYKQYISKFFSYKEGFSKRVFDNIENRIAIERKFNQGWYSAKDIGNPLVSIIIPAYNVEKLLSQCLESLIAQTYGNFEAIVVNDGSTDYTSQVCTKYAYKDPRIKIIEQENAGVSVARNVGIEVAKGEYITFIDADDWVEPNYLSVIVTTRPECDLLFFGNRNIHHDGTNHSYSPGDRYATTQIDREREILQMSQNDCWYEFYGYTWNKRFKRKIIKENHIRFQEGLSLREDELFTEWYVRNITSVACVDNIIYNYRYSYGGLTFRFHPGREVLLLAQGLDHVTNGIQHPRLFALKKSKVFHYMFTATLNMHTGESLLVFDKLYALYNEYYDVLTANDNPILDKHIRNRYKRIFAHPKWFAKFYYLAKRKMMKKSYRGV